MAQVGQTVRENSVPEQSFFVAEFTLPALSTTTVIPHGLAKHPKSVWLELKCLNADLGYAAGDRIAYGGVAYTVSYNNNNITLGVGTVQPTIVSLTSNAAAAITVPGNWSLIVKAEIA